MGTTLEPFPGGIGNLLFNLVVSENALQSQLLRHLLLVIFTLWEDTIFKRKNQIAPGKRINSRETARNPKWQKLLLCKNVVFVIRHYFICSGCLDKSFLSTKTNHNHTFCYYKPFYKNEGLIATKPRFLAVGNLIFFRSKNRSEVCCYQDADAQDHVSSQLGLVSHSDRGNRGIGCHGHGLDS